jgi:uncharacterized membrane protein YGL010W
MKTADEWFEQYGRSHQNPVNKRFHWVCVPLIMFSIIGLLLAIPSPFEGWWLRPATLALVLAFVFYALISVRLALGMMVVSAGMYAAALALAGLSTPLWLSSLVIFVAAWIGQFIGHKIEGKKPSFYEDLQFLLIGPLWLLGFVYRKLEIAY